MKNLTLVLMLFSGLAWAGSNPNPADYTINVHVSSSRVNSVGVIRLKVTIDGKKYELQAVAGENSPLSPGDYKARTLPNYVKDVHPYDVNGVYEFFFSDKKTRKYVIVGTME
jgi:hypothetical protein